MRVPAITIAPPADTAAAAETAARLGDYDLAVFVSGNAAEAALKLIFACGGWPPHVRTAVVGAATGAALERAGVRVDIHAPPPHDSEALLGSPDLHAVAGKRVIIFRGTGGRELLADTLRKRGAMVDYAEVYRRMPPSAPLAQALPPAARERIDVIVVTSNEGLDNLMLAAGDECKDWLLARPLVVIARRTAAHAAELGFGNSVHVAAAATDEALLDALIDWRSHAAPRLNI